MKFRRSTPVLIYLTWLAAISNAIAGSTPSAIEVSQAQIVLDAHDTLPDESAPWQPQALPDNWNISRPGAGGFAWYRIPLPELSAVQDLAIYIPRLSMNFSLYLNGNLLSTGGKFSEPVTRNWNRPQLCFVPRGLWVTGQNILHVRLRTYPDTQGGLSAIEIGPREALQDSFDNEYFLRIVLSQITGLLTVLLSGFIFLLWLRRREDSAYLYFSIGLLLWSIQTSNLFVRNIPLPSTYAWETLIASSLPLFMVALALFVFRFVDYASKWLERALVVAAACVLPSFLIAGQRYFHILTTLWYSLALLGGGALYVLIVRTAWRKRSIDLIVLAVTSAVTIVLGVHDYLVQMSLLPFKQRHLLQLGAPLLFLSIAWQLIDRFSRALSEVETLNRELGARVAQKTAELASNYEKLKLMEREQAATQERQRITRDMHDGLGSQLIGALTRFKHGQLQPHEVEHLLSEALDDLRLIIDAMEPSEGNLPSILGNLRYRLEPRLKASHITLEWRVHELPEFEKLAPPQVLQVMRIVQEAFTNILKHARATHIVVEVSEAQDAVFLSVSDNGIGMGNFKSGRGLHNMQRRAAALGGRVTFENRNPGTTVAVILPRTALQ